MTTKNKNIISISFLLLSFLVFGLLTNIMGNNFEKSFVEIDSLKNSKIELRKENYNLYSLNSEKKLNLSAKILENKTKDTLNISLSNKSEKKMFISTSQKIIINDKEYKYLSKAKISKNGIYQIFIDNSKKWKIRLAIQKENDDKFYSMSILIYYSLSIICIVIMIIKLICIIIKFKNRSKVNASPR